MRAEASPAGAVLDAPETLPVWLAPLPDESLFGVHLRHDEANGYTSGTTAKASARYATGPTSLGNPALQYLGTAFDLRLLGVLINADDAAVEALTFRRELRTLFGPNATAHNVGQLPGGFRVCRACVGERRFIGRLTSLPGIRTCPEHGCRLATACGGCGRPLRPFVPSQRPFACRCGFDWWDGPLELPSPQEALVQERVVNAYRFILERLPSDVVRAAERIARNQGRDRWSRGSEAPVHHPADLLLRSWYESLSAIVALLIERDLPPRALVDAMRSESPRGTGCHNRDCGAGPGEIRCNGRRKGHVETYCHECGSRFLGTQVIESYDFGHGDPRLSARSVRNARARLLRRQVAVADAARRLRAQRPTGPIRIDEVFAVAGIPTARNLRARRLRLVAIARAVLAGRAAVLDGPAEPDPTRWREHLPPPATSPRRHGPGGPAEAEGAATAGEDEPQLTASNCAVGAGREPDSHDAGLEAFLALHPDDATCLQELRARRWPDGFRCPACGGTRATLLRAGRLWHCSTCDLQTAAVAGTLAFGSQVALRTWFAAAYVLAADPDAGSAEMAARLGVSLRTSRSLLERLQGAVPA